MSRQKGAALLIVVLLLVTVAAFAVIVAASQSGGDVQGSDANADGLQALFLAESGLERALKRFATGTACSALLAETINDLSAIGLGTTTHRITIADGQPDSFGGAPPLPASQCRIRVTGTVLASNVSRTVEAIVDRNLLGGITGGLPFNATFNNPLTPGAPSGWAGGSYADNGGPDCSRSAWLAKTNSGGGGGAVQRSQSQLPVNFTTNAGSTTAITFHWRITDRTGACNVGGGGPAWPGACAGAGGFEGQVCFRFVGAGTSVADYRDNSTGSVAGVPCPGATPSAFAPCSTGYQPGYPTKQSVNMPMAGGVVNTVFFNLRLQQGGRREMFLDHIEATNDSAVGAAHVRVWRDCSTTANPGTCT